LKLRAWNRYGEARETYSIPFNQATIAPSIEIDKERLKNGLVYEVFEGSFKRLSNLTNQVSVKKGISSDLKTIEVADRETDFGLKYRGFIKIPEKGLYTFYLTSDDGSRLKIGDTVVAELNVLSDLDPWMSEGNIALNKGFYPIEIDYFQYRKRSRLELKYKNNSGTQKKVSSDMFFHKVD
jgi:hexosaminidase